MPTLDCLQSLGHVLIIILRVNVFTTSRHLNNWIRIEVGKREEKDGLTHTHMRVREGGFLINVYMYYPLNTGHTKSTWDRPEKEKAPERY